MAPRPDPVSAIAETDATGRTAEIYADIRDVMQLPLVTSIWRTLFAIEGGLESVWTATRPIYLSGWPEQALADMETEVTLPEPEPLGRQHFVQEGLEDADRDAILAVFRAYNRSNTLNLLALTALLRAAGEPAKDRVRVPAPTIAWPILPDLRRPDDIADDEWTVLQRAARLGLAEPDTDIPTLWRHLLHRPAVVRLVVRHYEPLQREGHLVRAAGEIGAFAERAARTAPVSAGDMTTVPDQALAMVEDYVGEPPSVARMVAMGRSAAGWFEHSAWPAGEPQRNTL